MPSSALCCHALQVGSQHRSKAEPAGAVINGKWVPSKPGADGLTLQGERRRDEGRQGMPGAPWHCGCAMLALKLSCRNEELYSFPVHDASVEISELSPSLPCTNPQASPPDPTAATWMHLRPR